MNDKTSQVSVIIKDRMHLYNLNMPVRELEESFSDHKRSNALV